MLCFTLCTNSYLALAKSLAQSWVAHHPGATCIIGLVDRPHPSIDYTFPPGIELLTVEDLNVPQFSELTAKYNVTELCTAVKPHFFEHLLQRADGATVFYLDPDILVYRPLEEAIEALTTHDIVVTPHVCTPIPGDDLGPTDLHILRGGVFNLGFLALRRSEPTAAFLKWWQAKMHRYAFRNDREGLFYDQIWANFIPCFFAACHVERHLGYNTANWNLHERNLSRRDGVWWVNDTIPLTFFHFSNYKLERPEVLAGYNHRYSFASRPDVEPLYADYRAAVAQAGHRDSAKLPGYFQTPKNPSAAAVPVVLRFSPTVATYVRSNSFHPSQRLVDLPSGEVEMSAQITDLEAFHRFILVWGENATVISPPQLATSIAQRLTAARANYDARA